MGFFALGFGGPGVQKATFHMAHLFPKHSGSLIAGSTALFDGGTVVFAAFYALSRQSVGLPACWLAYTAVCLFILGSGALLWPTTPFEPPVEDEAALAEEGEEVRARRYRPLREQLASPAYLYLVAFASVHVCRLNFVVATFQVPPFDIPLP